MGKKLSWDQIKQRYNKEWVELIDYDWPEGMPWPKAGVVRVHANSKKEFYRLANQDPPADSAFVYVGKIELSLGVVPNNLAKTTVCE